MAAQDPELETRLADLRARGLYREARAYAAKVVDQLEGVGPSIELPRALIALGRNAVDLGDYPAAQVAYDRAIGTAEATPGAAGLLADALGQAALLSLFVGQPAEAVAHAERARSIEENALDPTDPTLARVLANVSLVQLEADGADAASTLIDRARAVIDGSPVGPTRDIASIEVLEAEGIVDRAAGRYEDAERILVAALNLAEETFGPASMEVGSILNNLGMTWKFSGRFDDASHVYQRAVAILETAVGPDHPDVAALYHNLGGLEHARGDLVAAEPFASRSVEIRARVLGDDHVLTWLDRAALAPILDGLGREDEAEKLLRDAIERLGVALGPDHMEVSVNLNNLAAIRQRRGAFEEAEALYRRAITIKERSLGMSSPLLATSLNNLATVVRRQGRPDEAEALYRHAIGLMEASLEPSHPNLVTTRANLVRMLRAQGRLAEADAIEGGVSQVSTRGLSAG